MSFDLVTTAYGPAALDALAEAIRRAKGEDPLDPVTVVVPSNHIGVTARRLLARGRGGPLTPRGQGTIGVTFSTPYRLAEMLGAPRLAAAGRRPVSTPVLTAAVRTALRHDPGVFAPVAEHPATEEALVVTYTELADLSSSALDAVAGASPRAADVVRICRAARAHLAGSWYDESDLTTAARAALESGVDPAFGHLVVHLPQKLSRRSAGLLATVAERTPTTVIAGLTGSPPADRTVERSLERLGAGAPDDGTGDRHPAAPWPVSSRATRTVTVSDADEETRVAVQAVVDAAREGTPLERIAVLYPTSTPYARLLDEHLAAAGIRTNGPAVRSLADRTYGRALIDLLSLRDRGYQRRDLLGLLTGTPVRTPAGRPAPTTTWERLSRDAAVVAGRPQWDRRLADLAGGLERRAADLENDPESDEGDTAHAARLRRRSADARTLRQLTLDLIDSIEDAAAQAASWQARVLWLRRLSGMLLGGEAGRAGWPENEQRAADRVDAALDRLGTLDEIDQPCTLDVFRRTLERALGADLGRSGRFGEGVLVAPLSFGAGLDLDLLVVVGAAEGQMPAAPVDDSLLPDHERHNARGELPLRRELAGDQERQLRAALSSAGRHVLVAARGDLRSGGDRTISRWLTDMARHPEDPVPLEELPSFARRIATATFPPTAQEHRLGDRPGSLDDPVLTAGRDLILARQSPAFTRYDGNLAGWRPLAPDQEVVSATRLESWATCPHAYFVRHVLGVEPVEDPAEQLWISALDKGSLIHEVLERFLQSVLARPPDRQPGPDDAWSDADHHELRALAEGVCDDYEQRGLVGRRLFWQRDRDRLLTMLDRFLDDDDRQRRALRARPVVAEMAFGLPRTDLAPVELKLPGGRLLRFRGAVDRIDRGEDGTLRVIDYKTGRPDAYRNLSEENPDDSGTRLQLPVYAVAARTHHGTGDDPVRAEYWFVSDRDRLRTIGYQVTDDVLARISETLATIVDGIAAGVFPAHPVESASDPFVPCRYCNPDGIGVADRRREWERKRHDPALAVYTGLAEPDAVPPDPAEAPPR